MCTASPDRRRGLAALAALAALAGCGGGADKDDHRLSAAAYRARATRICTDTRRQTEVLGRPRTTAQFKAFLASGVVVAERNLRRFEVLRPPDDLEDEHEAIVAGERRGVAELRRLASHLHGDSRDVALLKRTRPELDRLAAEADARYRAAGLGACAT